MKDLRIFNKMIKIVEKLLAEFFSRFDNLLRRQASLDYKIWWNVIAEIVQLNMKQKLIKKVEISTSENPYHFNIIMTQKIRLNSYWIKRISLRKNL